MSETSSRSSAVNVALIAITETLERGQFGQARPAPSSSASVGLRLIEQL